MTKSLTLIFQCLRLQRIHQFRWQESGKDSTCSVVYNSPTAISTISQRDFMTGILINRSLIRKCILLCMTCFRIKSVSSRSSWREDGEGKDCWDVSFCKDKYTNFRIIWRKEENNCWNNRKAKPINKKLKFNSKNVMEPAKH